MYKGVFIVLHVNKLKVSYGQSRIIHGVTLSVLSGDKICLMGRNGVGKTTLLKSIMGILNAEKGSILFNKNDITHDKTYKRSKSGIAFVPQGREIFPTLTVKENLEIGCVSHFPKEINSLINEVLEYFPYLKEHLERKGGLLSGGQQQQLAIARALMSRPKVLLLDEPSEGIQPNTVENIAAILNRINKERNISIFLVEQNLDFATKIATEYYIMEKGSIVRTGNLQKENQQSIKQYLTI